MRRARARAFIVGKAWNALALVFLGSTLGGTLLEIRCTNIGVRLLGLLIAGSSLAALDVVMHEAAHGLLFRSRFWNDAAGVVLAVPGLLSFTAYRTYHLRHHRQRISEAALDGWRNGTPAYLVEIPRLAWRRLGLREKRRIVLELILVGEALAAVAILALRAGPIAAFLLLGTVALDLAITSLRGWTESLAARRVGESLILAGLPARVLDGLLCDHLEHHIHPGVPWHAVSRSCEGLRRAHSGAPRAWYLCFLWRRLDGRIPPVGGAAG